MPDDDEVKVFTKAEIDAEIERVIEAGGMEVDEINWLRQDLLEYKERFRLLAWNEVLHEGCECALELYEATQSTAILSDDIGQITMPGGRTESVFLAGQLIRIHKLIIVRENDSSGEAEDLEEIKISQLLCELTDSCEGYSQEDLRLAVEAWVKLGGDLGEIQEGLPTYLLNEEEIE
jgi:hypothetical protein